MASAPIVGQTMQAIEVWVARRRAEDALKTRHVFGSGLDGGPVKTARQPGHEMRGQLLQLRQQRLGLAKRGSERFLLFQRLTQAAHFLRQHRSLDAVVLRWSAFCVAGGWAAR